MTPTRKKAKPPARRRTRRPKQRLLLSIIIPPFTTTEDYFLQLRERLDAAGITDGQLAREAGIDGSQLSRWLLKKVSPSLTNVVRIERAILDLLSRPRGT